MSLLFLNNVKVRLLILVCVLCWIPDSRGAPLPPASEILASINERVAESESQSGGYPELSTGVKTSGRRFRFVFVHGYLGFALNLPFVGDYMDRNRDDLNYYEIPSSQIHEIQPRSNQSLIQNVSAVLEELRVLSRIDDKKLVIIPHSRGAPATIAALLSDLEFAHEKVAAVFPIQGAFGGSGVADYLWDENANPLPEDLVWYRKAFLKGLRLFPRVARFCFKGLPSLTHQNCRVFWEEVRTQISISEDRLESLSGKIRYVPTVQAPGKVAFPMKTFSMYLATYGPNDGLVTVDDASLDWIGDGPQRADECSNLLVADHADLMTKMTRSPSLRRGMIAAFLEVLFRSGF